jgi:hypothetical protein
LNVLLVAEVSPLLAAVKVYPVPDLLMLQFANAATPDVAANGLLEQPLRLPPPGFVPMASVIDAVLLVTV